MTGTLAERMDSMRRLVEGQRAKLEILRQLCDEQREMMVRLRADLAYYADRYHAAVGDLAAAQLELLKFSAVTTRQSQ